MDARSSVGDESSDMDDTEESETMEPSLIEGRRSSAGQRMVQRLQTTLIETTPSSEKRHHGNPESLKIRVKLNRQNMRDSKVTSGNVKSPARNLRKRKDTDVEDYLNNSKKGRYSQPDLATPRPGRPRGRSRSLGPETGAKVRRSERAKSQCVKSRSRSGTFSSDSIVTKPSSKKYCWICHNPDTTIKCTTCPRNFHAKCTSLVQTRPSQWLCPECSSTLNDDSVNTKSELLKAQDNLDQLCKLLKFTLERMKNVPESDAFWKAVDPDEVPGYRDYVDNPMDLELLKNNIENQMYGSTQAFLADAKWIYHNSFVFNTTQSKLTKTAKAIVTTCRQELDEIDKCADCYLNAHTEDDWFIQVCKKPHILIWARLKGYPFWPAKALSFNSKSQSVDARFFGAHDKAWVSVKDCFLLSKVSPTANARKRSLDLNSAFEELKQHIDMIKKKCGEFVYAKEKTQFIPEEADRQLAEMVPGWDRTSKKTGSAVYEHDIVVEQRLPNEDPTPEPEEEVMRNLELLATPEKLPIAVTGEELSTDVDDVRDGVPTPEHGYTKANSTNEKAEADKTAREESQKDCSKANDAEMPSNKESFCEEKSEKETSYEEKIENSSADVDVVSVDESRDKNKEESSKTAERKIKNNEIPPEATKPNRKRTASEGRSDVEEISVIYDAKEEEDSSNTKDDNQKKKRKEIAVVQPIAKNGERPVPSSVQDSVYPADFLDVKVEQLDFEQYLMEEENQEGMEIETETRGSIKVRDLSSMSGGQPSEASASKKSGARNVDTNVRLSDEVSLHLVESGNKSPNDPKEVAPSPRKPKKYTNKTKKNPPAAGNVTISTSSNDVAAVKSPSRNLNVISVDTKNSDAQKSLLKSLCLEEKKNDHADRSVLKAPPISVNNPVQNLNGPFFIGGQTLFTTNAVSQNIIAQNGQMNLVHLTNLTSGIPAHTNFMTLTNEALGYGNTINPAFTGPPPLTTMSGPCTTPVANKSGTSDRKQSGHSPKLPLIAVKNPLSLGYTSTSSPLTSDNEDVSAQIRSLAPLVTESVEQLLETMLCNLGKKGLLEARLKYLMLEKEKLLAKHRQEIAAFKEKEKVWEAEKQKALSELKLQMEKIIADTKKKQWCAHCGREALFYCCWNTSYCDYPCQQEHWRGHMNSCAQLGNNTSVSNVNRRSTTTIRDSNYVPMVRQNFNGLGVRTSSNVPFSPLSISYQESETISLNGGMPGTCRIAPRLVNRPRSNGHVMRPCQ